MTPERVPLPGPAAPTEPVASSGGSAGAAAAGAPVTSSVSVQPAPRPRLLSGVNCPACGGSLPAREGWTNIVCTYCNSSLFVGGDRGVARFMVLDSIERGKAEAALRRWLEAGVSKAPGLASGAQVQEAFLAWFPFVRSRFDVVGWVLGTERRTKDKRTIHVPREIEVERSVEATAPAADMSEFGVGKVNLAGDALVPLDEERLRARGMVFRPQFDPAEAERAILQQGIDEARAASRLDQVTFSWLRPVRLATTMVYYPLWVFRYTFRGRGYQALIDAEDGTLAFGQAPANAFIRALKMVGATAIACYGATTILQRIGAADDFDDVLGLLLIVGAVTGLAILWGYRQFRFGSLIEEGSGVTADVRLKALLADLKKEKTT